MMENCRNDLNKLTKTIEMNQKTLHQYENVIKDQQKFIEELQQTRVRREFFLWNFSNLSFFLDSRMSSNGVRNDSRKYVKCDRRFDYKFGHRHFSCSR